MVVNLLIFFVWYLTRTFEEGDDTPKWFKGIVERIEAIEARTNQPAAQPAAPAPQPQSDQSGFIQLVGTLLQELQHERSRNRNSGGNPAGDTGDTQTGQGSAPDEKSGGGKPNGGQEGKTQTGGGIFTRKIGRT